VDTWRYYFAVLLVISIPPALIAWFYIHPLVSFWRKVGTKTTITLMMAQIFGGMWALWFVRQPLVGRDFGTHMVLVILAAWLLLATMALALARRKHLTMRILSGVPELQADGKGGKLLSEGVYSRIRHPRYIEVILGTFAYAVFSNYLGAYIIALLTIPAVHAIVLLEERELIDRFGDEYREYAARIPRYIPKRRGG
jgi:protein-S-isoprenylcysteine O-methyltransferase Ste14